SQRACISSPRWCEYQTPRGSTRTFRPQTGQVRLSIGILELLDGVVVLTPGMLPHAARAPYQGRPSLARMLGQCRSAAGPQRVRPYDGARSRGGIVSRNTTNGVRVTGVDDREWRITRRGAKCVTVRRPDPDLRPH